ncbi:MAG: zf-TFIIB domain-containing protein [Bacteroidales bacterium]|nr:zf-TFIIB domain-containing protein [Bacteroidales bacterium]
MRSPISNEPMLVLELAGIEIDYCPMTHGIWLDAGELEELYQDRKTADDLIASFKVDENSREKRVRCPICNKKMEKVLVQDTVVIDRCTRGHGLWFDEGELLQVLEMESGDNDGKVIAILNDMFKDHLKK